MPRMNNSWLSIKNDTSYRLGIDAGFFAGFLLFVSAFYLLMSLLNKMPEAVKYYHIVLFVVIAYFAGFIFLKVKNG